MNSIAIIGPTASGKSALAHQIAKENKSVILSLDSLALYKEIDILSAKPSKQELQEVPYFGVDIIKPNQHFNAAKFASLYKEAYEEATKRSTPLIIVGGSSFYLKSLIEGFSNEPDISSNTIKTVNELLKDQKSAYKRLLAVDPHYASTLNSSDTYRIEKALLLFYQTQQAPSEYWKEHPKKSELLAAVDIYEVDIPREALRKRVARRTQLMFEQGAIDEVLALEKRYTRTPKSMQSIGILEILSYLDGKIDLAQCKELISIHTAQLAKRQSTFNRHQFKEVLLAPSEQLYTLIQERS
jgi:tRNA dimethylallyltransferase